MYFGASFPYRSSSLMIAEPTMAPSEIFAIFFACSGVEIPTACRNHAGNLQWGYSKLLGAGYATIVLKTPYRNPLWKRKTPLTLYLPSKESQKNDLDRNILSVKVEQNTYPRCHLDSRHDAVHLTGYQHTPGNWRMPARCRVLCAWRAFDCTLSGPFDDLFLPRLSATRVLCTGIIAVISASTVCLWTWLDSITAQGNCQSLFTKFLW